MLQLAQKIYHNIFPQSVRRKLALNFKNDDLNILRKNILKYYSGISKNTLTEEQTEVINYLKVNPISVFPYSFQSNYDYRNVKVTLDEKIGLNYVLQDGKRLYFKRKWTQAQIKGCYSFLQMEQDIDSPHRYLVENFYIDEKDVVFDIGAAEGNFSLSIIDKVDKVYLFETDNEWIEALEATFAPWKSKVEIINKFVSNTDDEKNIKIDTFLKDNRTVSFLKIDVEGGEGDLLKGCEKLLAENNKLKIAICTYHKQEDEKIFSERLAANGFKVTNSKGYMIFINDRNIKPPYLRRGLIRATK